MFARSWTHMILESYKILQDLDQNFHHSIKIEQAQQIFLVASFLVKLKLTLPWKYDIEDINKKKFKLVSAEAQCSNFSYKVVSNIIPEAEA